MQESVFTRSPVLAQVGVIDASTLLVTGGKAFLRVARTARLSRRKAQEETGRFITAPQVPFVLPDSITSVRATSGRVAGGLNHGEIFREIICSS